MKELFRSRERPTGRRRRISCNYPSPPKNSRTSGKKWKALTANCWGRGDYVWNFNRDWKLPYPRPPPPRPGHPSVDPHSSRWSTDGQIMPNGERAGRHTIAE